MKEDNKKGATEGGGGKWMLYSNKKPQELVNYD